MNATSDLDLLDKWRLEKSGPSFDTIVARHSGRLYRRAVTLVGDEAAAQDCVQETFAALASATVPITGGLLPWLYCVLSHKCVDEVRRQAGVRKRQQPSDWLDGLTADLDATDPGSRLDRADTIRVVWEVVDVILTREERLAFVLHKIEELTYEQVAQRLNVSLSTVTNQLTRALCRLRDALRSRYPELFPEAN